MTEREAMRLLGLEAGFDLLALKRAYRRKMQEVHPDRHGQGATAEAVAVNLAMEILEISLNEEHIRSEGIDTDAQPRGGGHDDAADDDDADDDDADDGNDDDGDGDGDDDDGDDDGDERDDDVTPSGNLHSIDNRQKGGALWAGIRVDLGTSVPRPWNRSRDGRVWTKAAGDVDELLAALLENPGVSTFTRSYEDFRPGGCLWSGFQVGPGASLPPGWNRAGVGRHAGQAWTQQEGDAQRLVQALQAHLGAPR